MFRCIWRPGQLLTTTRLLSAATESSVSVNKEALMKLRKRTGYSYVNCRKALVQFGQDNMEEAEKWLKELAKKEGWTKAAKLSNRSTSQGLIGFAAKNNVGAVVELLCETDFVARSDNFKSLLEQLSLAAAEHANKQMDKTAGQSFNTTLFELESVLDADGRSGREIVTMAIGKLGENITVNKIEGYAAPDGTSLYGAAHPKEGTDKAVMGKFVSIVAMKRGEGATFPTDKLASQICQHIIGMRSETLGEPPLEQAKDKEVKKTENEQDELNNFYQGETTRIDEDETALLRQNFMLNPSQSVYDYLTGHKAEVVAFSRMELGGENE